MSQRTHSAVPVFLVDDHPMVRQGLALFLVQAGCTVCGEAGTREETLAHPKLAVARIVIMDLSLGDENGAGLIPILCRLGLRVVVYSMHEDAMHVRRALDAGATGYVTKREAAQSIVEAVRAVLAGETHVSPRASAGLAHQAIAPDLTEEQRELYALLGQGCNNDEIAEKLHISPRTVETYCTRLMDKLGVDGMHDLRRRAIADRQPPPA